MGESYKDCDKKDKTINVLTCKCLFNKLRGKCKE